MRNSKSVLPIVMVSPGYSGCDAIEMPFTSVPFIDPRSVTTQMPCALRRSSACLRLAFMSWTTMSLPVSRPSVMCEPARS